LRERKKQRVDRGRKAELELVQHPSMRSETELQRSMSPVRYGMDLETQRRKEDSFDTNTENAVLDWIEEVTQEEVDSLYLHLKSGRTLCKLVNKLHPGIIPRINRGKIGALERENIANFRKACSQLGVKDHDIFDVNDLYKQLDLGAVLNTICALSRAMEADKQYKGKLIRRKNVNTTDSPPVTGTPISEPIKDRLRSRNTRSKGSVRPIEILNDQISIDLNV